MSVFVSEKLCYAALSG